MYDASVNLHFCQLLNIKANVKSFNFCRKNKQNILRWYVDLFEAAAVPTVEESTIFINQTSDWISERRETIWFSKMIMTFIQS